MASEVVVEADWAGAGSVPVLVANQFVGQLGAVTSGDRPIPDGVYLIVGHGAPPVVVGSPDSVRRQVEALGNRLPVTVHARFFLTRERLGELIQVLSETAQKYDAAAVGEAPQ